MKMITNMHTCKAIHLRISTRVSYTHVPGNGIFTLMTRFGCFLGVQQAH
jgi:hypothetical protein